MSVGIVTGATSGIGRAAALALAQAGWTIVASGRDSERGAEVARALGDAGEFLAGDIAADQGPERLVDRAVQLGPLKLVVHSAGIHFLADVAGSSPRAYDELMATNLRAAFMLARAAVPRMREAAGGVIVNVASEAALVAIPGQVAYNVSKAALVMLTKSLAVDHAADGIRAVSICPGTTRTPLVEAAIASAPDPAAHEQWLASNRPARRLGTPEEIAAAIVFAAGDEAGFMTGSELVVDGGYTAV